MTAAVNGAYGSYNYQSPESRALSSITQDSYDYRDQGKLINKLTGDVSYLANYMRKMQQGIDSANQNVIQQLQSLINDFLVLIGGGGDTGFDFGDLKYILQAIGSLFGFGPGLSLPINLGNAASHFFQEYVLGLANFETAVDTIIDTAIATILDWFGEVPIVGQAVQQLAVFITSIRDGLKNLVDNIIQAFTGIPIIGGAISAVLTNFKNFFNGLFGQETPKSTITSGAVPALDGSKITTGTIPTTVVPSLDASKITTGTVPAIRIGSLPTSQITTGTFGTGFIADGGITNTKLGTDISGDKIVLGTVVAARVGVLDGSKITTGTIPTTVVPSLDAGKITTGSFVDARIPSLTTSKITTGTFGSGFIADSAITNAKLGTDISGDKIVAGTVVAGRIGVLDASKITTGQFGQTFVTNLSTDLGYATGTADNATEKGLLNAADILALKSAQSGGSNSGYSATETFNTVSAVSLDTANWNISISGVGGKMGTNGSDAYWVNGATTPTGATIETDYWKTPTNGDYQLVTLIQGVPNGFGEIRMYARMDSTRLNYIMVIQTPSSIQLFKVIGGVATQMGSTYSRNGVGNGTWNTGDTVQLISGVGTNPRQHQVKRNNQVIIDSTTSDTTSVVGSSNRFAGFGMSVSALSGNIYQPGKVAAWSVSDNTPPNYVGSGFRAYKSTGTNSITANNFNLLPASFYSTEEYRTADMTYLASANNKLTVSVEGWYHVSINIGLSINTQVVDMAAALYKNGSVIKKGGSFWGLSAFGVVRGPASVNGNFIVYLIAGDYIQPGYWQTTAYGASGTMSADLYSTYFEVSLINKSLL